MTHAQIDQLVYVLVWRAGPALVLCGVGTVVFGNWSAGSGDEPPGKFMKRDRTKKRSTCLIVLPAPGQW